jgi:hypothetical protein
MEMRSVSQKKRSERFFDETSPHFGAVQRLAFRQKKGVNRQSEMKRKAVRKDQL